MDSVVPTPIAQTIAAGRIHAAGPEDRCLRLCFAKPVKCGSNHTSGPKPISPNIVLFSAVAAEGDELGSAVGHVYSRRKSRHATAIAKIAKLAFLIADNFAHIISSFWSG